MIMPVGGFNEFGIPVADMQGHMEYLPGRQRVPVGTAGSHRLPTVTASCCLLAY